jgi:hypothetical protein
MRFFIKPKYFSIEYFKQFLAQLKPGDTVFTDIDETLMHSVSASSSKRQQVIGSSSWFAYLQEHLSTQALVSSPLNVSIEVFSALQPSLVYKTVEPGIFDEIVSLQKQGVRFIGLTARDVSISTVTHDKLGLLGCVLDHVCSQDGFELSLAESNGGQVRYDRGIIFCSGNNKGAVLRSLFLSQYQKDFFSGQLYFIDDSSRNCENVSDVFKQDQLPDIQSFRYCFVANNYLKYNQIQFDSDRTVIEEIFTTSARLSKQNICLADKAICLHKKSA